MDANVFKQINFGAIAAETEKEYYPKLLLNGYIDNQGYINKIVKGPHFLVYGQKGSGKSAIGARLLLKSKEMGYSSKLYTLERLNYNSFGKISTSKEAPEVSNTRNWEIVLHIAILNFISSDEKIMKSNKKIKELIDGLIQIGAIPSKDIFEIVSKVEKKQIGANIKLASGETSTETSFQYSYENMYNNLREAVNSIELPNDHFIIIDGLDSVITHRDNQRKVLSGLLHAANLINDELHSYRIPLKIIVLCRTDVLDKLNDPNKQKIVSDRGIELNWYQHGIPLAENDLIQMINLRAKIDLEQEIDVFKEFFPAKIENKDVRKFLLDYTRHIPRDMIDLMTKIRDCCTGPISKNTIIAGINRYSADYFYGEIRDELVGILDDKVVDDLFSILQSMKTYRFTFKDMKATMDEMGIKMDLEQALSQLYDIGGIGTVTKKESNDEYTFKFRDRYSKYCSTDEIVIHLALQNALKARGKLERVGKALP